MWGYFQKQDIPVGFDNASYEHESHGTFKLYPLPGNFDEESAEANKDEGTAKKTWGNSIEFLMSCVALSVGFGNIWRFPFTAYENGGGAFLIPYVILLILVGKPFYFLETIVGQFSGKSTIKIWNVSPAFTG